MTDDLVSVTIPAVGVAMTEAAILRWLVAVGDAVSEGQHVAEVETDKVVMELESPATGVVTEILIEPGVNVEVNVPVATIKLGGAVARNPAEPPLQGAVVVHNPAAEETSRVPADEPTLTPTVTAETHQSTPADWAPKSAVSRAPFATPPRVRFADRQTPPASPAPADRVSSHATQQVAFDQAATRPWVVMSELSALGLERSLAEARRNRASASVTYTDLLISAVARAAVHAFTDRTVITSIALAEANSLSYREIPNASALAPEAIARTRPRGAPSADPPMTVDALHVVIVNGGRDGGDAILPPSSMPAGAVTVGIGSIAPRVVAHGGGVAVHATVHVSVIATPERITPQQLRRFVSTITEKLSQS